MNNNNSNVETAVAIPKSTININVEFLFIYRNMPKLSDAVPARHTCQGNAKD